MCFLMKIEMPVVPAPMFIDETWAKTNMAPLRGWAARGQRLIGRAPFGHWMEA